MNAGSYRPPRRLGARLHLEVRRRVFPFDALVRHAPESGTLVDIGCGHGLFATLLAEARPACKVVGFDLDAARIEDARMIAVERGLDNLRFEVGSAQSSALPRAHLVSIIDVLYLLSAEEQEALVSHAVRALEPGGQILIKEMSARPRWKSVWNLVQETLVVRVLKLTASERLRFHFRDERQWAQMLERAGLSVEIERLDRGYPHPHVLVRGTRA